MPTSLLSKDLSLILLAQFLSAFADNALLFTIIAAILQAGNEESWLVPAIQASFLVTFVVLGPFVGPFSDARSKPIVLSQANLIKAAGAALLFFEVHAIIAYAIVGLGAAIYSPAKYGVLPELVPKNELVRANGWIEGSTIAAILLGTLTGAYLAESSITLALILVMSFYGVSGLSTLFVTRLKPAHRDHKQHIRRFIITTRKLLVTSRSYFALLGVTMFWSCATVLRILLVAWAPYVLAIDSPSEIAQLTLFVAIGIVIGSLVAPRLIPIEKLRRTRFAAYVMGAMVLALGFVDSLWGARALLLIIGITGGIFVVPINATLQNIGHETVGSGRTVAIQNFFQNFGMLCASGIYAAASGLGVTPIATMISLGLIIISVTLAIAWHLPETGVDPGDH